MTVTVDKNGKWCVLWVHACQTQCPQNTCAGEEAEGGQCAISQTSQVTPFIEGCLVPERQSHAFGLLPNHLHHTRQAVAVCWCD